ncbi:hypothetical protein [Bosea rubneri]|uniref:Rap1a immunity protein domain-containing protein n=1 Tax=Bosea rubneri TaxID=3075434 RepID=A0ABU3SGK9_9HYPH|nr:hypothetical protein [Bosea sp. ZW T0_25]MDU0343821.1 hypothetical protein [Bosea sp. ZW T0_25]
MPGSKPLARLVILLAAALAVDLLLAGPAALAQPQPQPQPRGGENWPAVKCERYRTAYDEATRRFGTKGLGPEFLARHDAFMASGCQTPPDVCPRSTEELNLANIMVMAGMNAGLSSTFMPFACRK